MILVGRNKVNGKVRTWSCIPLQTRMKMTNTMLFCSYEWLINEWVRICFSKNFFFVFWKKVLGFKESVYLLNSFNQSNIFVWKRFQCSIMIDLIHFWKIILYLRCTPFITLNNVHFRIHIEIIINYIEAIYKIIAKNDIDCFKL